MNVAQALSMALQCEREDRVKEIMQDAPSGSGFDSGTQLDDKSTPKKLIFNTSYHHMDDDGFYTIWTHHKVIITPDFRGVDVRVTGKNYNDIKDYIGDVFCNWMYGNYDYQRQK